MATKFQYNEEAYDSASTAYDDVWWGQTFEHNSTISIEYVEFLMAKDGVGGNAVASIRAVSGGLPVGEDLAVSNPVDYTGIGSRGSYEWVTFNFISAYELSANTPYAIVIRSDQVEDNALVWVLDSTTPSYANGTVLYSANAGSSWVTNPWDFIFRAWGSAVVGGIVTPYFYNRLLTNN